VLGRPPAPREGRRAHGVPPAAPCGAPATPGRRPLPPLRGRPWPCDAVPVRVGRLLLGPLRFAQGTHLATVNRSPHPNPSPSGRGARALALSRHGHRDAAPSELPNTPPQPRALSDSFTPPPGVRESDTFPSGSQRHRLSPVRAVSFLHPPERGFWVLARHELPLSLLVVVPTPSCSPRAHEHDHHHDHGPRHRVADSCPDRPSSHPRPRTRDAVPSGAPEPRSGSPSHPPGPGPDVPRQPRLCGTPRLLCGTRPIHRIPRAHAAVSC
jgi:hypothetical protein